MHILFLSTICLSYFLIDLTTQDKKQARKRETIVIGLLLFLFAALRAPTVGTDIKSYFEDFKTDASLGISGILNAESSYTQSRDPIFHCFLYVLSLISDNPQIMLIVIGAIVAVGYSYFVYHSKANVLLMFSLFITLRMYSFTLSGLRQAMAMGFTFIALAFLLQKKNIPYLLFTLLAGLFHSSAWIFFIALPLQKIKKHGTICFLMIIFAIVDIIFNHQIVGFFTTSLFGDRFSGYLETAQGTGFEGTTTFYLYVLIYLAFIYFYLNSTKELRQDSSTILKIASAGIMFSIIGQSFPNMFRVSYYFIVMLFPTLDIIIGRIFNKRSYKAAIFLVVGVLMVQYLLLGTSAGTETYIFFWQ